MSTGQWIGAILGFVVGFIVSGGNIVYAIYGAVIGYTLGGIIDPVKADVKQAGAPAQKGLEVVSNIIGNPIFDVAGTAKITGQLLFFGKEFNRAVWYRPSKGVRAISGYKYYGSWGLGICLGEVDCLYTIFRDQDPIWSGELNRPISGGEATIQVEGVGTVVFYFGTADQALNANVGTTIADASLNTPYRHLCWAFFDSCFMNEYNRMPSMTFIVRKTPNLFSAATRLIRSYDVNPAHALWYVLVNKVGLPVEWLHEGDFINVAQTLYGEGRGISVVFDAYQATQNYLEAINNHVDCILKFGSDGKFHPRLIRGDYDVNLLPLIDVSVLIDEPTFSRKSWIDTINEVKVQYSEIIGERPLPPDQMLLFRPYSNIEFDESYLYIGGIKVVENKSYFAVKKLRKSDGSLVSEAVASFDGTTSSVVTSVCLMIRLDGTDLYAVGRIIISGLANSIIIKYNKDNLSTEIWRRVFTHLTSDLIEFCDGIIVAGGSLFVVGNYNPGGGGQQAYRRNYSKDGALLQQHSGIGSYHGGGLIADESVGRLYIPGSAGGARFFHGVLISDITTHIAYSNYTPIYYAHNWISKYNDFYYVGSEVGASQPYNGAIVKTYLSFGQVVLRLLNSKANFFLSQAHSSGIFYIGSLSVDGPPAYTTSVFGCLNDDASMTERWSYFGQTSDEGQTRRALGVDFEGNLFVFRYIKDSQLGWRGILERRSVTSGGVLWSSQ